MSVASASHKYSYTQVPTLGAIVESDGVLFRIWAPGADRVEIILEQSGTRLDLRASHDGYFERFVDGLQASTTYRCSINHGDHLPDPASRYQPQGVHGPSQIVDPHAYSWQDQDWRGIKQQELVFYELHVGTFTAAGTYKAAEQKLSHLRDLGITAVELMPLAEFAGRWNWGYDSAALYAPFHRYGTADELRHFVDAVHQTGISVFLDVVYNHFGPDGSYAAVFGRFFSGKHRSPWGQGINLDDQHSQGVRGFFIDNAMHWLREYHFDGLRLDATHSLQDDSPEHFLAELSAAVESLPGRKRYLIAEDERNLARLVRPRSEQGFGLDALWADDFHHQVRNLTAGDVEAYFSDFAETTADNIATTLRQGWYFTGQHSSVHAAPRGTDTEGLSPAQFVICIQNHDQVGNRPIGDRLHHDISASAYRAASALLLFAPQLPLLFMGQEWSASTPFQYFTDHNAELGRLITEGRRNEFKDFPDFHGVAPDPQDPSTFARSTLKWDEITEASHQCILRFYQRLLKLRPMLESDLEVRAYGDHALWMRRGQYGLAVAFTENQKIPLPSSWKVMFQSEEPEYAIDPHPAYRQGEQLAFPSPGAVVCRLEPHTHPSSDQR